MTLKSQKEVSYIADEKLSIYVNYELCQITGLLALLKVIFEYLQMHM